MARKPATPDDATAADAAGGAAIAPARFDDILERLRALVDKLEGGNLPLEESLRAFEQGMELCRQGAAILDTAEKRVETLLAATGGGARTAPFSDADAGADE